MNQVAKHSNWLAAFSLFPIISVVMALCFRFVGHSQTAPVPATSPQSYEVQSGDSLVKIARRYGVTVKAIMATNDLPNTKIKIGQMLTIPPMSASVTPPPAALWTNRPPPVPPPAEPEPHTWLQSASQEIEIGICDKNGNGDFPALFIVTGPDGPDGTVHKVLPEVTDEKRKSGDENYAMAYVHFPKDFHTYWREGAYSWQCFVESNCVASGAFEYHYATNGYVVIVKQ